MTPRRDRTLVHLGIRNAVLALDAESGEEVWRTKLKNGQFTSLTRAGTRVFAANQGEVWCLDALTGAVLWHNPLKGLGLGLVALFAGGSGSDAASDDAREAGAFVTVAEQLRRQRAQHQGAS